MVIKIQTLQEDDLIESARNGDIKQVRKLLAMRVNVNSSTEYGTTPLMCAVANGHLEIVKVLLDTGADIYLTNCQGKDALFYAVHNRETDIIEMIKEKMNRVDELEEDEDRMHERQADEEEERKQIAEELIESEEEDMVCPYCQEIIDYFGTTIEAKVFVDSKFPNGYELEPNEDIGFVYLECPKCKKVLGNNLYEAMATVNEHGK